MKFPNRAEIKNRRFTCRNSIVEPLQNFGSFTTLHGIRNIYNDFNLLDKASINGRLSKRCTVVAKYASAIVWCGSFVIGLILTISLINITWQRSLATPTITTVDTYFHPIWNVSFPAVTICNINKVYAPIMKTIIRNMYTEKRGSNGTILKNVFPLLDMLIRPREITMNLNETQAFREEIFTSNYTHRRLMNEVMQPCDKMIRECFWLNVRIPCERLFFVSETTEGFCCSFNYQGYNAQKDHSEYRVSGAGDYIGLDLLITPEPNEYIAYTRSLFGVQVGIHSGDEFANLDSLIVAQPGYDIKIMITPSVLISDPEIRSLPVSQRKCLFKDEMELEVNQRYSYASCMVDCQVKNIVEICNCIPFYYPHNSLEKYSKRQKCGFHYMECMKKIWAKLFSSTPPKGTIGFDYVKNHSDIGLECDHCLPDCDITSYSYQSILSNRRSAPPGSSNLRTHETLYDLYNETTIFIGFKDAAALRYRRSIYMTWGDLFAAVGGVFGLCLGASTISLIEVIYFFLIRAGERILVNTSSLNMKKSINGQISQSNLMKRTNLHFRTKIYENRNYWSSKGYLE